MKQLITSLLLLTSYLLTAQPPVYSIANAHSHNDYEKISPFWEAYRQGFGSMEADIFLKDGQLIVAHDQQQLFSGRTLDSLYLQPLEQCVRKNKGFVYADPSRSLQLLVDIKTAAIPTLNGLIRELEKHPTLTRCPSLHIVISGNRPADSSFPGYPSYINFDGVLSISYSPAAVARITMLSDNFKTYSSWNGKDRIPPAEQAKLDSAIHTAHRQHKKVRFWNAPDFIDSWQAFMKMGVDYINTDQITAMAVFLQQLPARAGHP